MIEIILVRHGQPDWEPNGRAVDDAGLTELGREQAHRLARDLQGLAFDGFHASPLRRAAETVQPIAEALEMEPEWDPRLAELGLPKLEGTPKAEVARFFESARGRDLGEWWDGFPGGEPFREFEARVTEGIDSLLAERYGLRAEPVAGHRVWQVGEAPKRVLVVAHGGTNAVILSHLLGLEAVPWGAERLFMGWAGMTYLMTEPVANGAIWSLRGHNLRSHLDGLPDPVG